MSIIVIGISHKTAPVKVRERFSFTRKHLEVALAELRDSHLVQGAVILPTCNRSEIYVDPALPLEEGGSRWKGGVHIGKDCFDIQRVKTFILFNIYRAQESDIEQNFYILEDADAIRHLFRVISGLDSQVLGETQIFTQVKDAWLKAKQMQFMSDELDEVFKKAQRVGKMIRMKTRLSKGNVSIGSLAIKTLDERFKDLSNCLILIVGAGKVATLISRYLKEKNIKGIFVANRTYNRALELARYSGGEVIGFDSLEEKLKKIDIVISSTSSPHIIFKSEMLDEVMQLRNRPLFIMDLALPRDVDPQAKDIAGISLYDLDDLKAAAQENQMKRQKEALLAEDIIQEELDKFLQFYSFLTVGAHS